MKKTTQPADPYARYHAPSHIRHVAVDDRVIILDIRSESYFALDPVASLMWNELTRGHRRDESLRSLGDGISGSPPEIEDDLEEFTRKCLARGLLTQSPEESPMQESPGPTGRARHLLALRAWWSLLRTKLSLSRRGFSVTYNGALSMAGPEQTAGDDAATEALARAVNAFARAENFFHLKKAPLDCLPRSLALFMFLRSAGLPAHHCIGVRPFPFSAHAWTECYGRVVHDDELNRNRFTVIARIPQ
jgi:hypothetical protein